MTWTEGLFLAPFLLLTVIGLFLSGILMCMAVFMVARGVSRLWDFLFRRS